MKVIDNPKDEFNEVIRQIRLDLNKLTFDIQNFSKLLNTYYYYIDEKNK